jgi:Ig-like domain CHU_C associated/Secretion system C-terminal sorting domain
MAILRSALFVSLMVICFTGNAQRFAVASTAWSSTSTWSTSRGGVPGASVPSSTDDVYIDGFSVLVAGSTNAVCTNLYVRDVTNSIRTGAGTNTITISGELAVLDAADGYVIPVNAVIQTSSASLTLIFTTSSQDAINPAGWGSASSIRRVTFNPGFSNTVTLPSFIVAANGVLTVQSGTLNLTGGLQGGSGASITVNSGASLTVSSGNISGNGSNLTSFPNLTVNGSLTSQSNSTSFINADIISLNSGGVINIGYNGSDQTQGWWFQSTAPSTFNVDPASTVNFNSSTAQNIFAQTYGNLTLGGTGSVTKTVTGAGSINLKGNLFFSNTSVTFTTPSANQVIFDGTSGGQSISGGGTANFNGGLQVNKSSGSPNTLTLSQNLSVQNGITLTAGVFNLGSNTINLSGNLVNDATLTPSTSTISIVSGSTAISGGSSTTLSNVTITPSGNLTAPSSLSVIGNFTNNGVFNANNGTITFNGSSAQTIQGSTNTNFNNITYNNNSTLTFNSPQSLSGALSITTSSGVLNANGNLILISTSTSDARISQITSGGTISGNVTVQRYLPNTNGARAYRYLASPVTNATASQWKASFPITGTFTDPSTTVEWPAFPTLNQTSPSMFIYNEARTPTSTQEDRFESFPPNGSSTGTTLVNGRGYAAFVRQTAPINTLSLTGTPQQGPVGINVTAQSGGGNDGWNLIGNPYPAPINWANVTIPGGVVNAISMKDNTNSFGVGAGGYVSFTSGVGVPISYTGTISSGQAFWVRATANATITFQEDDKEAISNPRFARQETIADVLRVHLSGNGKEDQIAIRLVENGNDAADNKYDAFKLKNDFINLSSLSSDGKKMAINGLSPLSCVKTVALSIDDVQAGSHEISFTGLESFQSFVKIKLIDKLLNKEQDVKSNQSYQFSVTSDGATFGSARFALQFSYEEAIVDLSSESVCVGRDAVIRIADSRPDLTYTFSSFGSSLIDAVNGNGSDLILVIPTNKLKEGVNTIDVSATSSYCTTPTSKTIKIESVAVPVLSSIIVTNGQSCRAGEVTLKASGTPSRGSYRWYDSKDASNPIAGAVSDTYTTSTISKTTSYYVSILNSLGCESDRKQVVAEIIDYADVFISQIDNTTLTSNFAKGNQWYKDGKPIAGAVTQQLKIDETGIYRVEVKIGSCSISTEGPFIVTGIETLDSDIGVSIYPNPTVDLISLTIKRDTKPQVVIQNSLGQHMAKIEMKMEGPYFKGDYNLGNNASGLYFVRIIDEKTGVQTIKKIIKN